MKHPNSKPAISRLVIKVLSFTKFIFLFNHTSYAQPRIVWDSTYGGSGVEYGHDFARIPGGFIAVSKCTSNDFNVLTATDPDGSGNHSVFGTATQDFWIQKLNDNGQILWQNSLGGDGAEEATCVAPTSDGGYILAGFIGGVGGSLSATGDLGTPDADATGIRGGGADMWIVKLNSAGIMQWHNIVGGSGSDYAHDVIQTSDGGYLVVGDGYSNDMDAAAANDVDGSGRHGAAPNPDIWVLKLRSNGTIQWSNMLGGSTFDYGGSCIEVSGGYLISGTSSSNDGDLATPDVDGTPAHGSYDYWVIKLDANGNQLWDNAIGGSGLDNLYSSPGIIATTDGNFVLTGRSHSTNGDAATALDVDGLTQHGNADYWAVKINSSGNILWRNHIGTSAWDEIESAYIACDGGIILSGFSESVAANGDKTRTNPNGTRCPWLVKLNNAGKIDWDYAFASAGPGFDGPHHGFSYGMTKDYYVLIDSIGGDYFVLTTSQNPAGGDKTAPNKGTYDSWFLKLTFELTADYKTDTVCYGTPTHFTDLSVFTNVKPTPVYSWDFGDPASGASNTSTAKNPTHTFTSPGNYTVAQYIQYECKYDTMIKTVHVPLPPDVSFPTNYYVCTGSSVSISPTVNPGGGNYAWITGQTTSSISVSPTMNTTYRVTYTDVTTGCSNTAVTTVTVNPLPTINISSQSNVLCKGGSTGAATVSVTSGPAPYIYSWNPTAQATATATGLSATTYSVTVTDDNGCSSTITATITEPPLLQGFIPASNDIICNGGTTGWALAGAIGGVTPYSFSWSTVPSQTTSTASNLPAGTYSVIITDNNSCTAQKSITLTEAPAITTTITVLSSPLCYGDATGSVSVFLNNGTAPYTYLWNPGAYSTPVVSGLTAGTYSLSINDTNGCTAESSVTIIEPSQLTMTTTSTPDHCLSGDGTATMNPTGGTLPYTFSWSSIAQTTNIATGLSAGTYTATLTDNNGCSVSSAIAVIPIAVDTLLNPTITNARCNGNCDGSATLQLSGSANGPYNYTWNTVPAQNSITATGLCSGTYVLTVSDASGCKDTMSIFISQPTPLSSTLTSTATLCFGDYTGTATANVSGGISAYTYNWQDGQATQTAIGYTSGIYTVTISDNNGCTITSSVQVNDSPKLLVNIIPSIPICDGQQAILNSNVAGGTPAYIYQWSTMQNTSGITTPPLSTNTTYSLLVTDNNGCTEIAITEVTVNPLPAVSFSSDQVAGCKPLCVNFSNTSASYVSQVWNFGNGGNSAQANPQYCFTESGSYNVSLTITDNNGCSNSITQNNYITVHPDPLAAFVATPQPTSILNPTVYFTSSGTDVTGWYWSFGDALGSSSTEQNTNYTYNDTGNYAVRLVVVNEFGCKDTTEKIIRINPDYVLYVPNTFTPNNDGINDMFIPVGIGVDVDKYEFFIYDRWGNLIFKSTNPNIGWDGKANDGKDVAQIDVYVWKVVTRDVLGKYHRFEGHISLLK